MAEKEPDYRVRGGGPHPHLKVGCTPEQLKRLHAEKAAEDAKKAQKKPPEAP